MRKILKIALEAKLANISVDALLDVINATPNPEIAAEVLLGIYPPLKIAPFKLSIRNSNYHCRYLSYDKYTDRLVFTSQRHKKVDAMVSKNIESPKEVDIICRYSEKSKFTEPKEGWKNVYIPISELEEYTDSCSLAVWEQGREISEEEMDLKLD